MESNTRFPQRLERRNKLAKSICLIVSYFSKRKSSRSLEVFESIQSPIFSTPLDLKKDDSTPSSSHIQSFEESINHLVSKISAATSSVKKYLQGLKYLILSLSGCIELFCLTHRYVMRFLTDGSTYRFRLYELTLRIPGLYVHVI